MRKGGCELFKDNAPDKDPTDYGISEECAKQCESEAMKECRGGKDFQHWHEIFLKWLFGLTIWKQVQKNQNFSFSKMIPKLDKNYLQDLKKLKKSIF